MRSPINCLISFKTKRFYMTSYLVLALAYCNTFEGMPPKGNVNFEEDPSSILVSHTLEAQGPIFFYQIQDSFIKECRSMLIGTEPSRVTEATMEFLKGKGVCVFEDNSHT
jgi:hypothetical protein